MRIRKLLSGSTILLLLCLINPSLWSQQTFPQNGAFDERPGVYAFTHATIVTDPKNVLSDATLLVENGRITAVGKNVTLPKGTVVFNLEGRYIYPSFIDLQSSYGLPEVKRPEFRGRQAPQMESNKKGVFGWNQAINAEQRAAALFSADDKKAAEYRNTGIGTVLTHYPDGIVRGTGALVTLNTQSANKSLLKPDATAHFSFDKGTSTQNYPNSVMGAVALLRQTYYDAEWYEQGGDKEERNLSLEAFNRIKRLPSFFDTRDKWSVLRADRVGDEFGIQYIIKGGGDEYQRIDEIKATNAALIVPLNFPDAYDVSDPWDADMITLAELKHWELAPGNLAALEKAGIRFAVTTQGLKKTSDLISHLRKAISYGLSKEKALEALTITPASLVKADGELGTLKKGMLANFIVTTGELFDEETLILENWVQGWKYVVPVDNPTDLRGDYDFYVNNVKAGKLTIQGSRQKPQYRLALADRDPLTPTFQRFNDLITIGYKIQADEGQTRLTGWLEEGNFRGNGELPNGDKITWKAVKTAPFTPQTAKADSAKIETSPVLYPFVGYGRVVRPVQETILFKGATVWTMEEQGVLENTDVLVKDGKISKVGQGLTAPQGARIIDAKGLHLTPGLIDEHSHIALFGVNEGSQSSSAEVRMRDAMNPEDVNIYRQLAGGVTTSQLLHGSANAIGGQSAVIKLKWGASPDQMWLPDAKFIKFALGENVKQSNWGDVVRVRYPQTRMGVEQVYYDHFIRAREYDAAWKAYNALKNKKGVTPPRRDLELEALAEILRSERFITCHSYVQSEINMLMSVGDSLGFKVNTFTHILEGYKVADKMAQRKIHGSTFADWWAYKMEVSQAIPYNAALMAREGVIVSINSDDAEMARRLNQEAAKTITFGGMSEIEALKMVTINPAKMLHLDNRMGSIREGKDADLVLWNNHPLSIYARPEYTIIEGTVYFSREEDQERQRLIASERARLIQKSIQAKAGGASTQPAQSRRPRMWHCEDILGEHAEHEDHSH